MNILNKLTNNYLKKNKKRTIVTIIGIILSGAMITAVSTLAVSFQGFMIDTEKQVSGSWEVMFNEVKYSDASYIEQNEKFTQTMMVTDEGIAQNHFSDEPFLRIKAYDETSLKNMGLKLEEGRMPQNDQEILLSKTFFDGKQEEPKLGDTITLAIGERRLEGQILNDQNPYQEQEIFIKQKTKQYTICGIMARPSFEKSGSSVVGGITLLNRNTLTPDSTVQMGAVTKKVKNIYQDTEEIASNLNLYKEVSSGEENEIKKVPDVKYNTNVLAYMGVNRSLGFDEMIYSVCGILIIVIAIGSVLVIYNSFAISVSERKKQFGMLSSIGATKKQLKKSVLHEATVLALIGIPLGIISGIGGIWVTLNVVNHLLVGMNSMTDTNFFIRLMVSWESILVSIFLTAITIYISAYIPAKKASKITPIDAIRQTDDVKVKAKKVKTPKWIRKLFGMEGEIALKNLKRSKKRYRTTVLSLIISIVLFITVNGFTGYMFKGFSDVYKTVDYDYMGSFYNRESTAYSGNILELLKEIQHTEGITKYIAFNGVMGYQEIPEEKLEEKLLDVLTKNRVYESWYDSEKKQYRVSAQLIALNEEEQQNYLKKIGLDSLEKDEVILINYTNMIATQQVESNITKYKEADKVTLNYTGEKDNIPKEYTIKKITKEFPYALENNDIQLYFITSQETVDSLKGELKENYFHYQFAAKTDNIKALENKVEEIKKQNTGLSINGQNVKEVYQANKNLFLIISIFLYGFIVLISLIGIANIFNTISTNITLRRREFANLKSIGMTDTQFRRMLDLECIFYGTKSLLYGLPIGIVCCYLLNKAFGNMISFEITIPWASIAIAIVVVYLVVIITMMYASKKVKKENIIDVLRDDNA